MSTRPTALLAALAALLVLALPSSASAASSMEVGIHDDRVMLQGSDEQIARAADEFQRLGIDVVRIFARWASHAPEPEARTAPAGFDGSDPAAIGYRWAFLDRAIDAVRARGMQVLLTVTGSGPLWASEAPARGNSRYKPSPARFAEFATAVARRYGDRVDRYIVWNEPNLPLWLQPQSTCKGRTCTPYSPHLYRRLFNAAAPAIRATDPGATILAGALAPRGENARSANAKLRPLAWLRAMGCVTKTYRRTRSGLCSGFSPVQADGLAYHPHGILAAPSQVSPNPDDAQLADLGRLTKAVDRVQDAGGLRVLGGTRRMPLHLTEYGYQTNPPDRFAGVSASRQSTYLQQAAYVAWAHPRVRSLVQYVWQDEPGSGAGWQSGLRRSDGRAKPALGSFPDPFWALRRDSRTVRVWGQVRPGASSEVVLERTSSTGRWTRVATVQTDGRGFYKRDVPMRGAAKWRARTTEGVTSVRSISRAR